MAHLSEYRAFRLEACRPFVRIPKDDPDDDLAGYALSQGFHLDLLEHYQPSSGWKKDSLYNVVREAVRHYQDTKRVILVDELLARIASRGGDLAERDLEVSAVGELSSVQLGTRSEVAAAIAKLRDIHLKSQYREIAQSIEASLSGDRPPALTFQDALSKIRGLARSAYSDSLRRSTEPYKSFRDSVIPLVEEPYPSGSKPPYMTGIPRYDAATNGLHPGDLFVIGGIAGVGKSWVLLWLAAKAAQMGKTAVLASAEMGWERCVFRLAGIVTGRDYRTYDAYFASPSVRHLHAMKIAKAIEEKMPGDVILIPPVHCQTTDEIREALWDISRTKSPDVLLIDYLQIIKPADTYKSAQDWEILGETTMACKSMGDEFGIPVITLAQTNPDRIKLPPAYTNIMYSKRINQIMSVYGELRHMDPAMDVRAIDSGDSLPTVRDMKLTCGKLREGPFGFSAYFQMDFSSGSICHFGADTENDAVSIESIIGAR